MMLWEFRGQVTRLETGPGLPETLVFHDVWVYQGCWNKGPQARQLKRHSISWFLGDRSPKSKYLEVGFLWGLRGKIFPWFHPIFWWFSDNLWCSLAHGSLFSSSHGVLPFLCVCLCSQIPLFGWGHTLMASSSLDHLPRFYFQIWLYSQVLGRGLQCLMGGGDSSTCNTWLTWNKHVRISSFLFIYI